VQGVGFRVFVKRVAQGLGIAGLVRNQADGSVEVVAEGVKASMRALESELRAGPTAARVETVERTDLESTGREGFTVNGR
jgi:acylphosphatase